MKPSLPPLAKFLFAGLAVALLLGGIGFWLNTASQARLEGRVLKVRTLPAGEADSIIVVDYRVKNPARALFQLKQMTLVVTTAEGQALEGKPMAQEDLDRVLDYHKVVGTRHNATLKLRDRIRAGVEEDRTAATVVPISEMALQARKGLTLRLQDADGMTCEITESAR